MTVAAATELWGMSATELAEAIRTRQASSAEIVEAHLRRIEAVNPAINAVVIVLGGQAMEAAERAVAPGPTCRLSMAFPSRSRTSSTWLARRAPARGASRSPGARRARPGNRRVLWPCGRTCG
jgi:Asp-tRNA(Asn)/Glu-tRNA(Gln) amidotransferase A subunit family amidase